jgi:hypothetical protein
MNMHMGLLAPESKTRFFIEDDTRSTYVFSPDAQGHVQLVVEDEEGKPGLKASKVDPGKNLRTKRKAVELPADVLDAYTGRYQVEGGPALSITRSDGKLLVTMSQGGMSMKIGLLTPESKTRFFLEDDPRATYVVSTDAQGRLQFVVENEEGKPGIRASKVDPGKKD